MTMKRKLVAILAGDVAGYSRLMGQNEDLAIQNWTAYRDYIDDVVGDHQGRLFNTAGDSLVFEFGSVLDALRCAVEVQRFLRDVNDGVPDQQKMLMRFGLHLSDVVVDRGNYLGDGINIAARLGGDGRPRRHLRVRHGLRQRGRQSGIHLRRPGRGRAQEHRPSGPEPLAWC